MAVSENVIVTLLDDTESLSVAEAMRLVLSQCPDPQAFISRHQDDENPRIRRHVQQLSRLLTREASYQELVSGMRNRKLSFWDGVLLVNDLADARLNKEYVTACFEDYASELLHGVEFEVRASTPQMVHVLQQASLFVGRGIDFFDVGSLLLSEVLVTGQCHPLLMCELVRQLGQRVGWFGNTVIYGGMYLLRTPEDALLCPENGWNVLADVSTTQCRLCSDHEMLTTYLGLLHVMSVVSRRPIGVYNFSKLLADINRVELSSLPYPLGDSRHVPTRSSLGESSGAVGSSPA